MSYNCTQLFIPRMSSKQFTSTIFISFCIAKPLCSTALSIKWQLHNPHSENWNSSPCQWTFSYRENITISQGKVMTPAKDTTRHYPCKRSRKILSTTKLSSLLWKWVTLQIRFRFSEGHRTEVGGGRYHGSVASSLWGSCEHHSIRLLTEVLA